MACRTIQSTPNPAGTTFAVSCTSAGACTAVGEQDNGSSNLAERRDGTTWTVQPTP